MSIIDRSLLTKNTLKNAAGELVNDAKYKFINDLSDKAFGIKSVEPKKNKRGEFSVDSFRSSFSDGLASPAYFQFRITGFPPFMEGKVNKDVLRLLPMRIRRAQMPDMALQTNPHTYNGIPTRFPYENSTGTLNLEIISSGNLWEREFFSAWQRYIIDYGTKDQNPTFSIAYYKDFITQAELDVYNDQGDIVSTFLFDGIWPMTMTMVDMDWMAKDTTMVFSIEISYAYWSVKSSTSGISKTIYEETSVGTSVVNTLKTMGINEIRKTLNNLF